MKVAIALLLSLLAPGVHDLLVRPCCAQRLVVFGESDPFVDASEGHAAVWDDKEIWNPYSSIQFTNFEFVDRRTDRETTESRVARKPIDDLEQAVSDGDSRRGNTEESAQDDETQIDLDDGEESFGEEPEESDPRIFLRQSTVLLTPGKTHFEYGVLVDWRERTKPIVLPGQTTVVDGGILEDARQRNLFAIAPIIVRRGISDRLQAFANIPFGLAFSEVATSQADAFGDEFGLGDVSAGINYQLRKSDLPCCGPELIATIGFTAPTGNQTIQNDFQSPGLGSGFWALSAEVVSVQSYDPVVLFFGLRYRHLFEKTSLGGRLQPGDDFGWQFGLGFAVNQYVTLSAAGFGSYVAETRFNDVGVPKSWQFPVRLRHAVTLSCNQCFILEPSIAHGLTSDASDVTIGLSMTQSF